MKTAAWQTRNESRSRSDDISLTVTVSGATPCAPYRIDQRARDEMLAQRGAIASCENDESSESNEARETQRFHLAAEDVVKTVLTGSGGETDKWKAKQREEGGRGRGGHSLKNAVRGDGCGSWWDDH